MIEILWSKEEGIHVCNLAFQIYLDLYTVADLTFDPVLETRYVDEKLIFLAILHLNLIVAYIRPCFKNILYSVFENWSFQICY